jgi:tRNA G37 N-methylase Trm5|tara:strand:+ start:863 stop:1909 length:1047 start_codon:yes stop_codon:yes gene_type:complete
MLHLRVPSQETERILQQLRAESALPDGARVQTDPSDSEFRLIPIIANLPSSIGEKYSIVDIEVDSPSPRTYRDHLDTLLPSEVVASTEWPTRHEFVGDLILIKLDEIQRQYGDAIGEALLRQHSRIRAVFEDLGVIDTFRVRDLRLLAVRDGQKPTTRTQTSVNGHNLWTDPSTVYYSSKLHHERERTLDRAKELRDELGRPLTVCDPYAGVGPSLLPLISEPELVGELFAGDLNPAAVEFLRENLTHPSATIECTDARGLKDRSEMRGKYDLLLVNIPHDAIEHLPDLLPLVRTTGMIRGWAIIEQSDFQEAQQHLRDLLGPEAILETRRSYSASADLCRFEARKAV